LAVINQDHARHQPIRLLQMTNIRTLLFDRLAIHQPSRVDAGTLDAFSPATKAPEIYLCDTRVGRPGCLRGVNARMWLNAFLSCCRIYNFGPCIPTRRRAAEWRMPIHRSRLWSHEYIRIPMMPECGRATPLGCTLTDGGPLLLPHAYA
jgi:hypothetical protein